MENNCNVSRDGDEVLGKGKATFFILFETDILNHMRDH